MSETDPKHQPLSDLGGARDAEILALRSKGWSLSRIGSRFQLSKEGVRQIINRRPPSDANKLKRDQVYAQLEAIDGLARIEAGMSVQRLAAIAATTPRRVEQWLLLKFCSRNGGSLIGWRGRRRNWQSDIEAEADDPGSVATSVSMRRKFGD